MDSKVNMRRSGFSLLEMVVVLGIITLLALVTLLTLNPVQMLQQSRDARRVSDLATLNAGVTLYQSDQQLMPGYSMGATSTGYISVPAAMANCSDLGIATSSGYSYACSGSSNYKTTAGAGWIPVNFQNIRGGAPFDLLAADPTNQTSSGLYYAYSTDGSKYIISASMESTKFRSNIQSSGGSDPTLYEVGTGLTSLPESGRGLVGYWPLNEGTGGTAIDWSGNSDGGTWAGTQAGTSGYYSAGKNWQWAGAFDGASTYVGIPFASDPVTLNTATFIAWIYPTAETAGDGILYSRASTQAIGMTFNSNGNGLGYTWDNQNGSTFNWTGGPTIPLNTWSFVAAVINTNNAVLYVGTGGVLKSAVNNVANVAQTLNGTLDIGLDSYSSLRSFKGLIGEARLYSRALSDSEIRQIYSMEQ